jgi:hypothetical protein
MPTTAIATAPAGSATPPGERVDPQALATLAAEVAHRQAAPNTRRAYAAAYRQLAALLTLQPGRPPRRKDLTPEAVRRYSDHLEHLGRDPATIANRQSAVRQLTVAGGADPACRLVRAQRAARPSPARSTRQLRAAAGHARRAPPRRPARPGHAAGRRRRPAPRRGCPLRGVDTQGA